MTTNVNSNTFKKNNKKSDLKQKKWIPLVLIVVLALIAILLNYFMIDIMNAIY